MAKGPKTPRGMRGQRRRSPTAKKSKAGRVTKLKKKTIIKELPRNFQNHSMKTRARAQQLSQSFDDLHNSQLVQGLQTPSTPKTPQTSGRSKQKNPLWQLLSSHRSFWDIIRDSCDDQSGSKPSSFGDDDITAIMNRLNQQVSHQFDSYKYEDSGFLSSSPSGYDPRETMPINEAEVEDLRVAIWPTLQHLVELTKSRPLLPHPKDCYLTQLRHVRGQLRDTWQNKGFPGNPPSPFQLEAWTGGITNWRTSYYTNGEDRFPASHVETQIEAWCLEAPSTPANDVSRASDDDASDNEIFHARHEFDHNNASPTLGHSYRRVMSALYDANRDVGLPTASQIQAYQSGATPTTTIPSNSMTDTGMSSPNNVSVFLPRRPVRILEDQQTPPPSSDDATALVAAGNMSPSSNKENDNDLLFRMDREQRERERTPSSSQDVINPAGERMARSERLGEEWEIEREWEYDGDCA